MDPDATLKQMRELRDAINRGYYDSRELDANLSRYFELADALDTWISNGGFLPMGWADTS